MAENMNEAYTARLQTPADENGNRMDIHLVTDADSVIVDENTTLKEKLGQMGIIMSKEQPKFPCLWARVISSTTENE